MRKKLWTIALTMFAVMLVFVGTTAFASTGHIHDENCLHEITGIRDFTEFGADLENYILERIPVEIESSNAPLITTSFPGGLLAEQSHMLTRQIDDHVIEYQLDNQLVIMSKELLVIDEAFFSERGIECCPIMHVLEFTFRMHHPTPGVCSVTVTTVRQCWNCGSIWSRTQRTELCFEFH